MCDCLLNIYFGAKVINIFYKQGISIIIFVNGMYGKAIFLLYRWSLENTTPVKPQEIAITTQLASMTVTGEGKQPPRE